MDYVQGHKNVVQFVQVIYSGLLWIGTVGIICLRAYN